MIYKYYDIFSIFFSTFALFPCSSNLWVILEEGCGLNRWPVVLPVLSKVNLNMHSQSDVSQSCWIYWIYCACLDWLGCPEDTLLPGNITDNALQCTMHAPTHTWAAAWSPAMEHNCSAGQRQSQATSFCMERTRSNLDTSIQWAWYTNIELQGQEAARKQAQDNQIVLSNSRS